MLQLTTFLTHQNGSIHEGLNLWKKNVDKRFEGVEVSLVDISKRDKETVYGTSPYPLVLLKKSRAGELASWCRSRSKKIPGAGADWEKKSGAEAALKKKSGAGAGAAKKLAGSPALKKSISC